MPLSVLANVIAKFTGGFLRTAAEKWVDVIIVASAAFSPWILGKQSAFWEGALNATVVVCLILLCHVLRAVIQVLTEISGQPHGHLVESALYSPDSKKETVFIPDPRPLYFRRKLGFITLVSFGLLTVPIAVVRHFTALASKETSPTVPSPPSPAISIYLGCEWGHIPIHIPIASTIHVMRLHPAIVSGDSTIPGIGAFEQISSTSSKELDWPSKSEGRWMTRPEMIKAITEKKGIPTPYAFDCTLTSYSTTTLEDIVPELIIDTSDGTRHTYPVSFNPLISGHSFPFYIVNVCSSGVTPTMVQWGDSATVRVLGESGKRTVPLKLEKRNWPTGLVPIFGPSSFLWNGMNSCQWDCAN